MSPIPHPPPPPGGWSSSTVSETWTPNLHNISSNAPPSPPSATSHQKTDQSLSTQTKTSESNRSQYCAPGSSPVTGSSSASSASSAASRGTAPTLLTDGDVGGDWSKGTSGHGAGRRQQQQTQRHSMSRLGDDRGARSRHGSRHHQHARGPRNQQAPANLPQLPARYWDDIEDGAGLDLDDDVVQSKIIDNMAYFGALVAQLAYKQRMAGLPGYVGDDGGSVGGRVFTEDDAAQQRWAHESLCHYTWQHMYCLTRNSSRNNKQ